MASLGAVGVAVATQKSTHGMTMSATGDRCKLVVFVHISNDATWLFTRRKNISQHWLRSTLDFFTPLKMNTFTSH